MAGNTNWGSDVHTLNLRRRGFSMGVPLCYAIVVAMFSDVAWSAEWSVQPSLSAGVGHDNNPQLTTGPRESTTVTTVTPTMDVRGRTERSDLELGLVLNYDAYSSDQVEDTNQEFLSLKSSTQVSERTKLGLDGEFRHDNLRQTVVTGAGAVNDGDADVGLIQTDVARSWWDLRPSWAHTLSERSAVRLSYGARKVTFDNASGTGLVDYTNQVLALSYSNNLNQTDSLNVTTNASRYHAPDVDNMTDTARVLVGVSRAFSETSRGSFAVGASSTKADIAGSVDRASGFVVEASANQKSDITKLDGTIRHDVSPSGSGRSVESDQLRMRLVRALSPKINLIVRATLLRNKSLQGSNPTDDRRYYEVEPAFEYQWMPQWFLRVSSVYRYQKFDAVPGSATSNAVFVGVAYDWQRQFFGR